MSRVIVEQALMGMQAVDNKDGTYTINCSVLGGQKLSFTSSNELEAKAMYTTLETKYLEALVIVQDAIIAEHDKSTDVRLI